MTRYNSTIKVHCKCKVCTENPKKAKVPTMSCYGYFYGHLPEDLKEKAGTKRKIAQKNRNKRVALAKTLHIAQKEANSSDWKLNLWFSAAAVELANKPFCMECGTFIPKNYYRHATAHILPKRKDFGFPSMSVHPKNRIFLGAGCGCHSKYDKSWDDASQMKVWPLVVEAFKEMYPYIPNEELKNIPNVLLNELRA